MKNKLIFNTPIMRAIEVEVDGDLLRFEKDGEIFVVKREIGKSDYSLIYSELFEKKK